MTGITVTYSAPSLGASGKFSDTGSNTTTAVTNALGVANAAPFTANGTVGSYTVIASIPAASAGASFSLDNTAAVTLATGTYVFFVSGTDNLGIDGVFPYSLAGALQVGGGGIVGGGELDFNNYFYADNDLINGPASTISQGTDGNFILTLTTCNVTDCTDVDLNAGVSGVITLDASLLPTNSHQGFVTEFDSAATGSGTFDFQTSTSLANNGYAFALNGLDPSGEPLAIGGVINVNGTSVTSGEFDANDAETLYVAKPFSSGTISAPDSFGRVSIALMAQDSADFPEIGLAGYPVDGSSVRLVETADSYLGGLGGSAYSQGSTMFASGCTLGTSYVVGLNGIDTAGELQAGGSAYALELQLHCERIHQLQRPHGPWSGRSRCDHRGKLFAGRNRASNAFESDRRHKHVQSSALSGWQWTCDVPFRWIQRMCWVALAYQQTASSFSAANLVGAMRWTRQDGQGWNNLVRSALRPLRLRRPARSPGPSTSTGSILHPSPAEVPDKSVDGAFTGVSTGMFIGTIKGWMSRPASIFMSGRSAALPTFSITT